MAILKACVVGAGVLVNTPPLPRSHHPQPRWVLGKTVVFNGKLLTDLSTNM